MKLMEKIPNYSVSNEVDGKNIITFNSPRNITDETSKYYKGFQIANNIWIVPQRYEGNVKDEEENGGVYDETYLSTQNEQQKFLEDMILLFKRINSTELGRSFLSLLTAAVPFPIKEEQEQNYNGTNYILDIDTNKFLGMNIIIYGPGQGSNLMDFKSMPLNKENASNGIGTTVEICFTPHLTFQYEGMIQDPVLSLWQQLIYAMHMLYGIKIPEEYTVPYEAIYTATPPMTYSEMACEKILVAGGQDYRYARKLPQWPNDYFQKIKDNITTTKMPLIEDVIKKQVHPNGSIPEAFYECLQKKYNIDPQVIWNITIDKCASNLGIKCPPQPVFQNDFSFNSMYYDVKFPPDYITQGIHFEQTDQICKKTIRQIYRKPIEISDFLYQDKNGKQQTYSADLYYPNYSDVSADCYKEMLIDSTINNNDNELLVMENTDDEIDSIDYYGNDLIDSIDQINAIIFDLPNDVAVSKIEKKNSNKIETQNSQTNKPLIEHYLKVQRDIIKTIDSSNPKKITLTNSLIEAIENRDQQYTYSPFINFSKTVNSLARPEQLDNIGKIRSTFYSYIQQIAKTFKKRCRRNIFN
ncbi:tetanus/botulinum neurotoxin (plasmid) [Bacillus toyonensis]